MNAERLINAIGNIGDKYVLEYTTDTASQKKKPVFKFSPKWSIAACLAVVVAVTALILPTINKPDTDLEVKMHIFSSYEEFSAVIPDTRIIENLSYIDDVELEIYGAFQDLSIEDATKIENFSHFEIGAKTGDQYVANVNLRLNDVADAEKHIENSALTSKTEINGISVSYAYNSDMEYWDSVVVVDQNYYNILFHSSNEQEFIDFLTILLKTE